MPDAVRSKATAEDVVVQNRRGGDLRAAIPPVGAPPPAADSEVLLEVRDLKVAFPTESGWFYPVREVSLRVLRGQRVGIIGESGAGKSLTALALMRLIRPPGRIVGGEVFLNGRDLLRLGKRDMAGVRGAEVAIVYQNPMAVLNPIQRIGDQIVEAIRVHQGVTSREARQRALDILSQVGVPQPKRRIDSYPHQFSGGMRQRVMIGIALSADPDLLIADEPTTALDVTTQVRILDLLSKLVEERNTALLLITHDLGVAASICTDMRVMYGGRIVEEANAARLFTNPTHPYTEALIRSIVGTSANVEQAIRAIPGQPPLAEQLPSGCSFHPRCPYAADICQSTDPVPIYLGDPVITVAECHFARERFQITAAATR